MQGRCKIAMTKIKILGSGREVGRAAIAIEEKERSLLLDYGVNFDDADRPIFPMHIRPKDLDALVLTHSHLDHIGAAPSLFISLKPKIIGTRLTLDASRLLLMDMIKINGAYLPYDGQCIDEMLSFSDATDYEESRDYGKFSVTLKDSGHIPGSASVLVEVDRHKILYTSDINTIETKLKSSHKLDSVSADTILIESTYSTSNHPDRKETEKKFYDDIIDVVENGGVVLVPAFSISRGQEIMSVLEERNFPYPVWIDGMIRDVAELYVKHKEYLNNPELLSRAMQNQRIVKNWGDRRKALREPGVIIASAGMLKGGPSLYYMKRIADNERDGVFMVSYQAPMTPGRKILEEGVFEDGNAHIKVRARVEWFDFSSHTDKNGIIETIKAVNGLERVILVHGEFDGQFLLSKEITEKTGLTVLIPSNGDEIELD